MHAQAKAAAAMINLTKKLRILPKNWYKIEAISIGKRQYPKTHND